MGREVNAFWLDFTQAFVPKTTIHSVSCEPYVDSAVVQSEGVTQNPTKRTTMMIAEKVKFQLEIPLNSSKGVLFNCISTPSGLAEWFCDDVNIKKDVHIFFWDGSEESARMVSKKKDEFVKFRWLEAEEEGEDTFFELRIRVDDLTGENALVITDFADDDEVEDAQDLWHAQVNKLRRVLGC